MWRCDPKRHHWTAVIPEACATTTASKSVHHCLAAAASLFVSPLSWPSPCQCVSPATATGQQGASSYSHLQNNGFVSPTKQNCTQEE